jgi:hypothetical protein
MKIQLLIILLIDIVEWIKICNIDSLGNGDLIGFDYNNKDY